MHFVLHARPLVDVVGLRAVLPRRRPAPDGLAALLVLRRVGPWIASAGHRRQPRRSSCIYAISRTPYGAPIGPMRGHAELPGVVDMATTMGELVTVVALLALPPSPGGPLGRRRSCLAGAWPVAGCGSPAARLLRPAGRAPGRAGSAPARGARRRPRAAALRGARARSRVRGRAVPDPVGSMVADARAGRARARGQARLPAAATRGAATSSSSAARGRTRCCSSAWSPSAARRSGSRTACSSSTGAVPPSPT